MYDEGHFKLNRSYVYLASINFVSVWIALHSLLYFYKGTKHMLKPINPVGKFLTIKAIIFFSFWLVTSHSLTPVAFAHCIATICSPPLLPPSLLPPLLPHTHRQSVVIALLVKLGALPHSWKQYDMDNVALSLQNFLICVEMLVAAIAHYFVFSHKPFIDPAAAQVSPLQLFGSFNQLQKLHV